APEPGGAPISRADFRVKGTNVLIYVDGLSHHVGDRLRRDRAIRRALRQGSIGWQVVELTAKHLGDAAELERVRALASRERERLASEQPPPAPAYPIAVVDTLVAAQP